MEGLEPPQLSLLEPKSSVSTNSTTPARYLDYNFKSISEEFVKENPHRQRCFFKEIEYFLRDFKKILKKPPSEFPTLKGASLNKTLI